MIKCIKPYCTWPECDHTCGLVPLDPNTDLEDLVSYLQEESASLRQIIEEQAKKMNQLQNRAQAVVKGIRECYAGIYEYTPTCPIGAMDCIHDPAYLKKYHSKWWIELGMPIECPHAKNCDTAEWCEQYDDEDK